MKGEFIVRQGDVLFRKVSKFSEGATSKFDSALTLIVTSNYGWNPAPVFENVGKEYVVAEGEVSGHKHQLTSKGDVQVSGKFGNQLKMILAKEGTVTHDEHGPVTLPKGNYVVTQERELDYADQRVHDVVD